MSGISDFFGNYYKTFTDAYSNVASIGGNFENDVSKFFESESEKSALRGAEIESVLSGVPVVGNFLKGIEGVNQMEDLYRNTGKVLQYPALQNSGGSALGKGLAGVTRKIENGTHDLFEHYSGAKDDTIESLHEKGEIKYGDEI